MCFEFVRKDITVDDRIAIASVVLSKQAGVTISQLAREYHTSRKFISEQVKRVEGALEEAFSGRREEHPVVEITEPQIKRAVQSLALECHSSVRGIVEHLESVWGIKISEGKVVQILKEAAQKAEAFNGAQDLSGLRRGAHDEIFSQGRAVLVGVDVDSSYLYILESPGGRDSTTWGVVILEKQENQQLALEVVVADAAGGLRRGVQEANPQVRIHGDVFHAQREMDRVVRDLEKRAYDSLRRQEEVEKKALKAKAKGKDGRGYARKRAQAKRTTEQAIGEFDQIEILSQWMKELWQVSGYDYQQRSELYDWMVGEMQKVGSKKVNELVRLLCHQKEALLAFVQQLDQELAQIKEQEEIGEPAWAWLRAQMQYQPTQRQYWTLEAKLVSGLGQKLNRVKEKIAQAVQTVVRASSLVETINSLLRRYFFLRKRVGRGFLPLVQFYLNTRKYRRSARPERVGKSPLELLTSQPHPHWLDLLDAVSLTEPPVQWEGVWAHAA